METVLQIIGYVVLVIIAFLGWLTYQSFVGKNQIILQLRSDIGELKAIRDALMKELKEKETLADVVSEMINKNRTGLAVRLAPKPKTVDIYEEELDN